VFKNYIIQVEDLNSVNFENFKFNQSEI
jgi:hypothetical protein